MRKRLGAGLALVLATGLLAACYTVPQTGRQALMMVPRAQMASLGQSSFQKIRDEEKVAEEAHLQERVARVGRRITRAARADTGIPADEWVFVAFADDAKNAFALPGGRVGVYKGILDLAETDAELATVIAHEVAHVAARHGGERMSEMLLISLGGMALSEAMRDRPAETRQAFMVAYGLGAQVGRVLPHSRQQELEADHIGLLYMARAGYDPRAAIDFWQAMDKQTEDGGPPAFLSTHPGHGRRIQQLRGWLPEAMRVYRRSIGAEGSPAEP
jgi:predicted Zn-dependent protease